MSIDDYKFNIEKFKDIQKELSPLWKEHHNELVGSKIDLNPSIEGYVELEEKNALVIFTVRKDNILVGYSFFLVYPHLHRQQILVALNDLFFITKSHRKGWLASKFIKYFEQILFANNVSQIMMRTKSRSSFAPLLKRCGFVEEEISYIKKRE